MLRDFLHNLFWVKIQIKWYWRWKEERMPLNWSLITIGAVIAFTFTKPNLVWLAVTVVVYLVCAILHYLRDTGPGYWNFAWYIYTVGLGYFLCAVFALLFRLPVYNLF